MTAHQGSVGASLVKVY